ncbi:MAG: hypothetical protein ACTSRO_02575 [Candidatus Heimdallarchaeaceae archaeon]
MCSQTTVLEGHAIYGSPDAASISRILMWLKKLRIFKKIDSQF